MGVCSGAKVRWKRYGDRRCTVEVGSGDETRGYRGTTKTVGSGRSGGTGTRSGISGYVAFGPGEETRDRTTYCSGNWINLVLDPNEH